jgi:tRNA dimethylallyltransferase
MKPTIYVLTGCTAVGKTEWALRWAEANDAEIISCDSLLFYRHMDIGTAKPTPAELGRVPHHLIDVVAASEPMDITRYITLARAAVETIAARGRKVLVTGGSGFYLKSFFGPVADDVAVPAEVRAAVAVQLEQAGIGALVEELRALNPAGLGALDVDNPRRVTRALERCRVTGKTLAELKAEFLARPGAFAEWPVALVRLERSPEEVNLRIDARVETMVRAGLVEEVRRLRADGFERNPSAAGAIGYREVLAMLDGKLSSSAMAAEIAQNTRALVRKQRTWFRTQLPEHRVVRLGAGEPRDFEFFNPAT